MVFFSLCASDANDSPRGVDFLFDENRLNVANWRAQSLAIVVGNPK
ncbi:P-loop NTPase family protein [Acinetobacter sp. ANC 4633]